MNPDTALLEQLENKNKVLQSFVNNVFAMLDCQSDDLDDGIFALNKLIEKNHRLVEILTEIHETNSSIPFSIYAKYL